MIGFVADIHAGNHKVHGGTSTLSMNERCHKIIEVLRCAVAEVVSHGGDTLVIGGDLFDNETPTPQMCDAIANALSGIGHTIVILGNHERVSSKSGDHAIGWLDHLGAVEVIETPTLLGLGDCGIGYMVPFQEGDPKGWLPAALDKLTARAAGVDLPRSLYIHLGLRGPAERTNKWAAEATDAIDVELLEELCVQHGITNVFAGNWHSFAQHVFDKVVLTQVGALVPTGYDNPGLIGYGGVVLLDRTDAVVRLEIPGPRFVKVGTVADLHAIPLPVPELYVRCVCLPKEAQAAHAYLEDALEDRAIKAYEIQLDETEAKEGARVAARSARDTDTLAAALDVYVDELSWPAVGVTGDSVKRRCRGFLDMGVL